MESISGKPKVIERIVNHSIHQLQYLPHDYLLELAAEVLHIPKDERDEKQNKILKLALQEVQFFKKMITDQGDNLFVQCLDRIQYLRMHKDQIICSIGEPGSAFYVVISGEVSVNVPVQRIDEKANKKTGKHKHTHFEMQEVSVLKAGAHFGELALLNDAPRTATIICKEECNFAVLFRDDFKDVLSKHAVWQIQQDVLFFSSLPIFATSSKRAISTLIYHFQLLKFSRNNVIFKEGDEATHLYIIKKGDVKISKKVAIKPPEDPFEVEDESALKKTTKRILDLVVLGQKEIFGEEELYYGKKRETTATVASTDAEIFAIDKKDFERRLLETDEFTDYFNTYCKDKLDERNKRIQFIVETVTQSQDITNAVKHRPASPNQKRPASPSPTKRPASPSSTKRSPNQNLRQSFPQKQEEMEEVVTMSQEMKSKIHTNRPNQLNHSIDKTLDYQRENIQSPSHYLNSPVMNKTHQSFFKTNYSAKKKSFDVGNKNAMTISTMAQTRYESILHANQTTSNWNNKAKRSVVNSKFLFEKNIFEDNKPKILVKPKIKSKTQDYRRRSNDSLIKQQSDLMNRTHFSTKKREYIDEKDLQSSLIDMQENILREKLKGESYANGESIAINFLDDFPKHRRKPQSPPSRPQAKFTLADCIKNLPIFKANELTKTEQANEVKNIHMHSRRMQAFVNDIFRNQVKILRHIGFDFPQRPNSSYKRSPDKSHKSTQNSILLNDQAFKNSESIPKTPVSGHSDVIRSMKNSSVDLNASNQFIMAPRYYSRENSLTESQNPKGILIRSLKGKSLNDSL